MMGSDDAKQAQGRNPTVALRDTLADVIAMLGAIAQSYGREAIWASDGLTPTGQALVAEATACVQAIRRIARFSFPPMSTATCERDSGYWVYDSHVAWRTLRPWPELTVVLVGEVTSAPETSYALDRAGDCFAGYEFRLRAARSGWSARTVELVVEGHIMPWELLGACHLCAHTARAAGSPPV
jgi:hypothetical protein